MIIWENIKIQDSDSISSGFQLKVNNRVLYLGNTDTNISLDEANDEFYLKLGGSSILSSSGTSVEIDVGNLVIDKRGTSAGQLKIYVGGSSADAFFLTGARNQDTTEARFIGLNSSDDIDVHAGWFTAEHDIQADNDIKADRDISAGRNITATGNIGAAGNINTQGNVTATGTVKCSHIEETAPVVNTHSLIEMLGCYDVGDFNPTTTSTWAARMKLNQYGVCSSLPSFLTMIYVDPVQFTSGSRMYITNNNNQSKIYFDLNGEYGVSNPIVENEDFYTARNLKTFTVGSGSGSDVSYTGHHSFTNHLSVPVYLYGFAWYDTSGRNEFVCQKIEPNATYNRGGINYAFYGTYFICAKGYKTNIVVVPQE